MSEKVTKEDILRISGVNPLKCMRCGKCSGTCPAYDEMSYHPHQFVYMVERGEIDKLMEDNSIYRCLTCFACVDPLLRRRIRHRHRISRLLPRPIACASCSMNCAPRSTRSRALPR